MTYDIHIFRKNPRRRDRSYALAQLGSGMNAMRLRIPLRDWTGREVARGIRLTFLLAWVDAPLFLPLRPKYPACRPSLQSRPLAAPVAVIVVNSNGKERSASPQTAAGHFTKGGPRPAGPPMRPTPTNETPGSHRI